MQEAEWMTILLSRTRKPKPSDLAATIKSGYKGLEAHEYLNVAMKIEPKVVGGIGEKKSNGGTQWYQQDRIYDGDCAISLATGFNPYYTTNYRIRKLTPKECFRLMGFSDEDYEKCKAVGMSDSQLYRQAGNSIVVQVLEEIFKQML